MSLFRYFDILRCIRTSIFRFGRYIGSSIFRYNTIQLNFDISIACDILEVPCFDFSKLPMRYPAQQKGVNKETEEGGDCVAYRRVFWKGESSREGQGG